MGQGKKPQQDKNEQFDEGQQDRKPGGQGKRQDQSGQQSGQKGNRSGQQGNQERGGQEQRR